MRAVGRTLLAHRAGTAEYDSGSVRVLAKTVLFERRGEAYTSWVLTIGSHRKRTERNCDGSGLIE